MAWTFFLQLNIMDLVDFLSFSVSEIALLFWYRKGAMYFFASVFIMKISNELSSIYILNKKLAVFLFAVGWEFEAIGGSSENRGQVQGVPGGPQPGLRTPPQQCQMGELQLILRRRQSSPGPWRREQQRINIGCVQFQKRHVVRFFNSYATISWTLWPCRLLVGCAIDYNGEKFEIKIFWSLKFRSKWLWGFRCS